MGAERTASSGGDELQRPFFPAGRKRLVLIASTGGHLTQLVRLAEREGAAEDSVWVTFDSPQSRALLADRRVLWVDYVAPRDLKRTAEAYRRISRDLDPADFDGAMSTGAAVGVAGLAWAKRHGLHTVYVESVSRTHGPSLTGKIVRSLGLARTTHTQHSRWASEAWRPTRSVLKDYRTEDLTNPIRTIRPLKMLVTLGTIQPYRFDRLIDRIVDISIPGDEIIWQLGHTRRAGLVGEVHELMPTDELLRHAQDADVVLTHAGVGTILQMLDHGVSPVVVPRRKKWNEHIDDHQMYIWHLLNDSNIGHPVEVSELTREVLIAAASSRVVPHQRS